MDAACLYCFTVVTIANVMAWQRRFVAKGSPSFAFGHYQIMKSTRTSVANATRLSPTNELYDGSMQDKMAMQLLKGAKLEAFLAAAIDTTAFGLQLALVWASLPVLARTIGRKRMVDAGESFNAGDGLNSARAKVQEVKDVLTAMV